jgi:GNAT superfamily N-acetyltransferase
VAPRDECPFGPDELRATQGLARRVWEIDPSSCNCDATTGELAWSWASAPPERRARWKLQAFDDSDGLRGWGWFIGGVVAPAWAEIPQLAEPSMVCQVLPGDTEVLGSLLDWFDEESDGVSHWTRVRAHDTVAHSVLEEHGYVRDTEAPWTQLMTRSLDEIKVAVVPDGYTLCSMAEFGDLDGRVAVHRAAWHPSKQSVATYTKVTETWPYRADLDIVVVAPDGSLACSVLVWHDRDIGELEPVGTHPSHRRLGLAAAASLFALRKLSDLGATIAAVQCRGDDAYPIPKRLYESVGFVELTRDWVFKKKV